MPILEIAPAKINFYLRIVGRRPDGYHQVETILQTVDLADRIWLQSQANGITLECSDERLPCGPANLAYRAAALLAEAVPGRGVHIYLEKNIPWLSGLGGGSSDAAAVLRGLNRLWGLNWPKEKLLPWARLLGADVPFFVYGGTALGQGRGDVVRPLPAQPEGRLLVIQPPFGLSTARVYRQWSPDDTKAPAWQQMAQALDGGNWSEVGPCLYNDLERPACQLQPELGVVLDKLRKLGLACLLSGSGSCIFVLCPRWEDESAIVRLVENSVLPGYRVFAVETLPALP